MARSSISFTGPKTIYLALCIPSAALVFMLVESSRSRIRNRWLPVVAVLLAGVSFGLPMFLYMREKNLQ